MPCKLILPELMKRVMNIDDNTIWSQLVVKSLAVMKHCQRNNGPEGWVQSTSSYTNLDQISISETSLNLNLKSWPNLASESWPRFNIVNLTKHQQQNTDQTSASKSRLDFNFKIDKIFCSKSEQKLSFMIKPQLPNLQQTVAITILIINNGNSNNLKFWVGIFTRQGHINQVN